MLTILLATYNSSHYIRELLDSILAQTYKDWTLVIRDDVSSDNTVEIVNEYIAQYPGKFSLLDNHGESKRAYLNFVELMKNVESDYYMFCDHDDVWLPDKIELSIKKMNEVEKDGVPAIVHTDMKVVNQNLQVIHDSFWVYSRLLPEHNSFVEMVLCNSANGCTMLFNHKAKEVSLPNVEFAKMHDMLLNQSVAANGGVISPIYEATVLYRQHIDNVVGAKQRNFIYELKRFLNIPMFIKDNYDNWNCSRKIKKYSFAEYIWTKVKIMYYKIQLYK